MHTWIMGLVVGALTMSLSIPPPMEPQPSEWPLERITANIEQSLREHPGNVKLHYDLGRALGYAFALERSTLWCAGSWIEELADQREHARSGEAPAPAKALERLADGVFHLRTACELESPRPEYRYELFMYDWLNSRKHLTFAWLLETGAHLAERVPTMEVLGVSAPELSREQRAEIVGWIADLGASDAPVAAAAEQALASPAHLERALALLVAQTAAPNAQRESAVAALLERYWIERAIAQYWIAYSENVERDLSVPGWELERLVSYEALLGYERLVRRRGVQSPEEEKRLVELAQRRPLLEARPRGELVTPILLSLECRSLEELVAPALEVSFDLDGDGVVELWPWISPGAGWLVWDPNHRGEISSGRQLFGTASAWLFFEDGYRVLDALDDDRDGEVRGAELDGIAVWFDRDTDGVSDPGEVVPVEELGIVALSTRSTLTIGDSPANLGGLELADGRVLPTYDWVLAPAPVP